MNRRQFLEDVGSIMGLVAGGSVLGGCATHRGMRFDSAHGPDLDAYVASLDLQLDRIRSHPRPRELEEALAAEGLPLDLVQESLAAMLVAGAFRDLPRKAQRDPRMQAVLEREAQPMGQAVLTTADWLDRLPRKRRRELRRTLREESALIGSLHKGVRDAGREQGVHIQRTAQLEAALDDVDWRLKRQDPDLVLGEVIDKVDHHATANLLDRREWGEVATDDRETVPVETLARSEARRGDTRAETTGRIGLRILGISGVVLAGSAAAFGLGAAAEGGTLGVVLIGVGLVGATHGVLGLLAGLIFLLVSATQRSNARRAEEAALEEVEPPAEIRRLLDKGREESGEATQ